mgnify:CR=1 FL=1
MQMKSNQCPQCSYRNPPGSTSCKSCGSKRLNNTLSVRTGSMFAAADPAARSDVLLPLGRLLALAIISFGLYFPFWLYSNWKRLAAETDEPHYPLWHTLAIVLVPVYGLFRLHRHIAIIKSLAKTNDIDTTLEPFPVLILYFLAGILQTLVLLEGPESLALFALILTIAAMIWAQSPLNSYWYQSRSEISSPSVSVWEMILVGIGIVSWIGLIIPASP